MRNRPQVRYAGKQSFAPHHDGSASLGGLHTQFTFLVYLSDVVKGGETRFFDGDRNVTYTIRPEVGKALIFEHPIRHEGLAAESGTKYILRTDVLYGRDQSILDDLEKRRSRPRRSRDR